MFILPAEFALSSNSDFSDPNFANIEIMSLSLDDLSVDSVANETVFIVNKGKLGVLPEGLLHIADFKQKVDVAQLPSIFLGSVTSQVEHMRRTRLVFHGIWWFPILGCEKAIATYNLKCYTEFFLLDTPTFLYILD